MDTIGQLKERTYFLPSRSLRESKDDFLKRFCSETPVTKRAYNRMLEFGPGHIGDFFI
jgi:hypothetical protein